MKKLRFEIPECRRCCVCLPLRYGILIFGYLNLMFSSVMLWTVWVWMQEYGEPHGLASHAITMYKGVELLTQMWLPAFLYFLDVVFNVVLLVGAHLRRVQLIKIYYYYSITTSLAALVTLVALRWKYPYDYNITEFCFALSSLILQTYLLLIIRSELKKRRYKEGKITYVNNAAEVSISPAMHHEDLKQINAV